MVKYKQNISDFYHPSFVNYREFFVDDKYKDFDLDNCKKTIDAGASVGLFTQYILNRGAKQVCSICPLVEKVGSILSAKSGFIANLTESLNPCRSFAHSCWLPVIKLSLRIRNSFQLFFPANFFRYGAPISELKW
jgi:hypothetical protein